LIERKKSEFERKKSEIGTASCGGEKKGERREGKGSLTVQGREEKGGRTGKFRFRKSCQYPCREKGEKGGGKATPINPELGERRGAPIGVLRRRKKIKGVLTWKGGMVDKFEEDQYYLFLSAKKEGEKKGKVFFSKLEKKKRKKKYRKLSSGEGLKKERGGGLPSSSTREKKNHVKNYFASGRSHFTFHKGKRERKRERPNEQNKNQLLHADRKGKANPFYVKKERKREESEKKKSV